MTVTFKSPQAVPHKYRNRFLRDAGGTTVISGGSSGSSVDLSSYLKRIDADQRFLRGPLAINAGLTFDDFFEKDIIDEETGEWVIKAKKSLYSVGGISAYAYGEDEQKVVWNQVITTGTCIAQVIIDGVTTNVYAPNGGGGGGSVNSWTDIADRPSWLDLYLGTNKPGVSLFTDDGTYALKSHVHVIGDVTGLQTALDGKVNAEDGMSLIDAYIGANFYYDDKNGYELDGILFADEVTDQHGNKLSEKADSADVYTKTEIDGKTVTFWGQSVVLGGSASGAMTGVTTVDGTVYLTDSITNSMASQMAIIHRLESLTDVDWQFALCNSYTGGANTGVAVGMKFQHGTGGNKWSAIASVGESTYANSCGLALYANEAERVRISGNGYVGIGTTEPTQKLHVVGNAVLNSTDGTYIQIGGARIVWDSKNTALKIVGSDGSTVTNLYATGGVSAYQYGASEEKYATYFADLKDALIQNPSGYTGKAWGYDGTSWGFVTAGKSYTSGDSYITVNNGTDSGTISLNLDVVKANLNLVDAYSKAEVDDLLDEKAEKATTLAGYYIEDAYTKAEVDVNFLKSTGTKKYTAWGQTYWTSGAPQTINGDMTSVGTITFSAHTKMLMCASPSSTWSDDTNTHPWYGYDHTHHNTGVNSTTISDYYGMRLHTYKGDLVLTKSGYVGIGQTAPTEMLHLYKSADDVYTLYQNEHTDTADDGTTSTVDQQFVVGLSSKGYATVWHRGENYMRFGTNGKERMRITSDGIVGIGTTEPTEKLDVNGSVNVVTSKTSTGNGYKIGGTTVLLHSNSTNNVFLTTNEGSIYMRPNGVDVPTGQIYIDKNGALHIGNIILSEDTDNNALVCYKLKADGVTKDIANFYATGGVSAYQYGADDLRLAWDQVITTGTCIAHVTIDGVTTDVYAPESGGGGTVNNWADISDRPSWLDPYLGTKKPGVSLFTNDAKYLTSANLTTWTGTKNITTVGTITTGTWNGTAIKDDYIASADRWDDKQDAISVGDGLTMSGTTVSHASYDAISESGIVRGIVVDALGHVTDVTTGELSADDIPVLDWSKITTGKPTTLSGYGITDAYTKTDSDSLLSKKADKATTLSGYGITDAYTKTQVDAKTVTMWGQSVKIGGSASGNMTGVGDVAFSASGKNIGGVAYFDTANVRLGVGVSKPGYKLEVGGDGRFSSDVLVGTVSGARSTLKANGSIELYHSSTPYIDFHYGNSSYYARLSASDAYTLEISSNNAALTGLKIGDAYLRYDTQNGSLYVCDENGDAMNFYATGCVSAFGIGGEVSYDDVTVEGSLWIGASDIVQTEMKTLRVTDGYQLLINPDDSVRMQCNALVDGELTVGSNASAITDVKVSGGYLYLTVDGNKYRAALTSVSSY